MLSPRETKFFLYQYDPLDRLIANIEKNNVRQFFYCKSKLATEIQGTVHYSIIQHGAQLLAQQIRAQDDAPDTALLATDQQHSVLLALGAVHQRQPINYSPYGHHSMGNGLLSLLCFSGQRPDPVTKHYLLGNGYRAYNTVLMRFNSPDSLSPCGKGGINPYAYCLGDPINRLDPSGRVSKIAGAWLERARVRIQKRNAAKSNSLSTNVYNVAENRPHPKTLKDMAYNKVNTLLWSIPGKEIQKLPSNDIQRSGLRVWEKEIGSDNMNFHRRYADIDTIDYDLVSAGIKGDLNGVTPRMAHQYSQKIASGEIPFERRDWFFETKINMSVRQQEEIYRQAGLALPDFLRSGMDVAGLGKK